MTSTDDIRPRRLPLVRVPSSSVGEGVRVRKEKDVTKGGRVKGVQALERLAITAVLRSCSSACTIESSADLAAVDRLERKGAPESRIRVASEASAAS